MSKSKLGASAALLLIAAACASTMPSSANGGPASGGAIYQGANCALCHSADLSGTSLGPSLFDLSNNWTAAELADYVAHPEEAQINNLRLRALDQEFSTDMPPFDGLSPKHRMALAEWLLVQVE